MVIIKHIFLPAKVSFIKCVCYKWVELRAIKHGLNCEPSTKHMSKNTFYVFLCSIYNTHLEKLRKKKFQKKLLFQPFKQFIF